MLVLEIKDENKDGRVIEQATIGNNLVVSILPIDWPINLLVMENSGVMFVLVLLVTTEITDGVLSIIVVLEIYYGKKIGISPKVFVVHGYVIDIEEDFVVQSRQVDDEDYY